MLRPLRTVWVLLAICCVSCSGSGGPSDVVDSLAERGIGALAEGRWRCTGTVTNGGSPFRKETVVAIDANGTFSFEEFDENSNPISSDLSGTWEVDGLKLRLVVPWDDDGSNGFYRYDYSADADPPTRLRGDSQDAGSVQDLKLEIGKDRVRITQTDAEAELPDRSQPSYGWDFECRRESSDPGSIPPSVPPATRGD